MSSESAPRAGSGALKGLWRTISPRFAVCPDWRAAANQRRWPGGLALLFAMGLGGSVALLALAWLASKSGYVNTLGAELEKLALAEQLFVVALYAPLAEELMFRLALTARPRWGVLAAACALGVLNFVGSRGPAAAIFAVVALASVALWAQALVAGRAGVHAASEPQSHAWGDSVACWWAAHPRWPVWCSVAAFGLVHLANYDVAWTAVTVAVAPLVVSPQMWLGLMFTIARVRYGWWAGLVLHACHNLTVWSVASAIG